MYVALKRLKWQNRYIEAGDRVPEGEPGRNYARMVAVGDIAGFPGGLCNDQPTEEPSTDAGTSDSEPSGGEGGASGSELTFDVSGPFLTVRSAIQAELGYSLGLTATKADYIAELEKAGYTVTGA